MSATKRHVTQMLHVQILWARSPALVKMDSLGMEHTVKTSMNAMLHHLATQMQPALTIWDHTRVNATLATQETEHIVMVSIIYIGLVIMVKKFKVASKPQILKLRELVLLLC